MDDAKAENNKAIVLEAFDTLFNWDVIQDEAAKEQSKSGNPMFGDKFPIYS